MNSQSERQPKILIVEDDEDQRLLISEVLGIYYNDPMCERIVTVDCGQAALEQDFADFDIVLQDYNLPDMTGLQLLQKILVRCDVPVIFVTGENDVKLAAEAIRTGAQDYVIKLGDYLFALPIIVEKNIRLHSMKRENERLQSRLESAMEKLQRKNEQLQESMKQLKEMATTDHLTGLYNRRHFTRSLDRIFSEAIRYGFDLTCCMLDLDHYKQLNDTLGHQIGDEVLTVTADVIRSSLRTSDFAGRYGGDEFVLLLPHASVAEASQVAERIRHELAELTAVNERIHVPVHLSIGIASIWKNRPTTAESLVAMADRALYQAKSSGRNHLHVFDTPLTHSA